MIRFLISLPHWKRWPRRMSDIKSPVPFTTDLLQTIASKMGSPTFTHRDWGSPELEAIRSHIREHYRTAQNGFCAYCRNVVSIQSASNCHVEHIAPKSRYQNFMFEPKNLCVVCADCNEIKREQEVASEEPDPVQKGKGRKIYPRSSSAFKIVHPHFDVWERHIQRFGPFFGDKTDKGHFTIGACKLNRHLRKFGWESEYDDSEISADARAYLDNPNPAGRAQDLQKLKAKLVLMR